MLGTSSMGWRLVDRVEVLALALAACGPDAVPNDGGGASGSSSGDTDVPSGLLCPSLGLAPEEPLLVTVGGERVAIVHADGSIRELDPNPAEVFDDGPWVTFAVSSGAIATSSERRGHVRLSLFTPTGDFLWATEIEGDVNPIAKIQVSPDGIVAFNTYHDAWTVEDGEATRYERFDLLAVPHESRMAVARTGDGGWTEVGWIDLDSGEFSPVPVFGDVTAYGDLMVGVDCVEDGSRLYVATPEGVLAELEFGGYCLQSWIVDGSTIRLFPRERPEAVATVDLDDLSRSLVPIVPPEGYAHVHCNAPGFDDETMSVVLSNGTQLSLQRRLANGQWEPTLAEPLTDTNGATHGSLSGTFVLRSWRHTQCEDDPLLPAVEGTARGHSLQLWRPASGVKLVWDELEQRAFEQISPDGRCVAWSTDEGPLVVVDMETGAHQALAWALGTSFRFAGTNETSVGWAYRL